MLQGASILVLSSIDWSFNQQNPQEAARALAEWGNRVLFVENTGVRAATMGDAPRLWARFRNWQRTRGKPTPTESGVDVLSPLLLPFPYSHCAVSINRRVLVRQIRAWKQNKNGPLIVITFLPTPLARAIIRDLDPALIVYYCIDRFAESSPGARSVVTSELKLLAEASLVLVTSGVLHDMASQVTPRVELLPSGVGIKKFERARHTRAQPHQAFASLSRPIVGYIGSLRSATDLELLEQAATLAPDLQFVLIGPHFVDVSRIRGLRNVRLLDAIPHEEVMHFMVRFDVGILPYSINPFTAGIMPVKLKEYLAAGLPVVATPLPEVCHFARRHRGLVAVADNPPQFVSALRAAVSNGSPEAVERRINIARQYDWNRQMERMIELIEQALMTTHSSSTETREDRHGLVVALEEASG